MPASSDNSRFDLSLSDTELLEELELMTDLIIAASESGDEKALCHEKIDRLLGIEPD
jgi:hypothetical protein